MSALARLLEEQQVSSRLIIVDDIMFYCGMRRKIYQLAREHGAGYAVVHVDVPLALAQARNAARPESTRIPEEVRRHHPFSFVPLHIFLTLLLRICVRL